MMDQAHTFLCLYSICYAQYKSVWPHFCRFEANLSMTIQDTNIRDIVKAGLQILLKNMCKIYHRWLSELAEDKVQYSHNFLFFKAKKFQVSDKSWISMILSVYILVLSALIIIKMYIEQNGKYKLYHFKVCLWIVSGVGRCVALELHGTHRHSERGFVPSCRTLA